MIEETNVFNTTALTGNNNKSLLLQHLVSKALKGNINIAVYFGYCLREAEGVESPQSHSLL